MAAVATVESAQTVPLVVHVLWPPGFNDAQPYARALFAHLFEDPGEAPGLRIPLYFWTCSEGQAPPEARLTAAELVIIVALVDDGFAASVALCQHLAEMHSGPPQRTVVVPVSLSERAAGMLPNGLDRQAIALQDIEREDQLRTLIDRLTHRLWGELGPWGGAVPVLGFDAGGEDSEQIRALRSMLSHGAAMDRVVAFREAPLRENWESVVARNARDQRVLLAVLTARTPEWWDHDVQLAEEHGMAVVVLDAAADTRRYEGRAPQLVWGPTCRQQLLSVTLREALRSRHFARRVEQLGRSCGVEPAVGVQLTPPARWRVGLPADRPGPALLVYPDPPVGSAVLDSLRRQGVLALTPVTLMAS